MLSQISWFVIGEEIDYLQMMKVEGNNWCAILWWAQYVVVTKLRIFFISWLRIFLIYNFVLQLNIPLAFFDNLSTQEMEGNVREQNIICCKVNVNEWSYFKQKIIS